VLLKSELNNQQKNVLTLLKPLEFLIVIINDILDLAKVNAGKMNFEENPLNSKPNNLRNFSLICREM
jgi:signal transduction histidine kinase